MPQSPLASLEVLERTGVRSHDQDVTDPIASAGAIVDGNLVYILQELVEKAHTTVPKRVVLCDRNGERVMSLEGYRSNFGPGSDCLSSSTTALGSIESPCYRILSTE